MKETELTIKDALINKSKHSNYMTLLICLYVMIVLHLVSISFCIIYNSNLYEMAFNSSVLSDFRLGLTHLLILSGLGHLIINIRNYKCSNPQQQCMVLYC